MGGDRIGKKERAASGATERPGAAREAVSAVEATRLLGVKPQTLYAYVSRGFVRRVAGAAGRESLYVRADLLRLQARQRARAGHGPAAAGALLWGEAVLTSSITAITEDGPCYRGELASALASAGRPFEEVAELLWAEAEPTAPWPAPSHPSVLARLLPVLSADARPIDGLQLAAHCLAQRDPDRFDAGATRQRRAARQLIVDLAVALALFAGKQRLSAAARGREVSEIAALALALPNTRSVREALDAAFVLCADHELNASTFVARIVASAGSDLYAIIGAALATAAGSEHGGASDRIEALFEEARRDGDAARVIRARLRRGEAIPGFGHPFYAAGDPRGRQLLDVARALPRGPTRLRTADALSRAMRALGHGGPAVDFALVALCEVLGAPRGSAVGLFALGRAAGWIAHTLEQQHMGLLLRPRARYDGPPPRRAAR